MPTYLLGIAVGEFDVLADRQDGVELRILTARGRREQVATQASRELREVLLWLGGEHR